MSGSPIPSLQPEPFEWSELIGLIKARQVVPVVGRELLEVPVADPPPLLDHYLARKLAEDLKLEGVDLDAPQELQRVVFKYLQAKPNDSKPYTRTTELLGGLSGQVPQALLDLASITDLDLFISTTVDDLLLQAINQVRHNGSPNTLDRAFVPRQQLPRDQLDPIFPPGWQEQRTPLVYRIFGKASWIRGDFALSEADHLEFMHLLLTEPRRTETLFQVLKERSLLFIGCGFPDWLSRFFIRALKSTDGLRGRRSAVVDQRLGREPDLVVFLRHFDTMLEWHGGARKFVSELHSRWSASGPPIAPSDGWIRDALDRQDEAVFVSFASEDRARVRSYVKALRAERLNVFFDEDSLPPGTHLDVLDQLVDRCAVFLPFVSDWTEKDDDSPFRREWNRAAERAEDHSARQAFIMPVMLDQTEHKSANVPARFRNISWHVKDQPMERLVQAVRDLVRERQARNARYTT